MKFLNHRAYVINQSLFWELITPNESQLKSAKFVYFYNFYSPIITKWQPIKGFWLMYFLMDEVTDKSNLLVFMKLLNQLKELN